MREHMGRSKVGYGTIIHVPPNRVLKTWFRSVAWSGVSGGNLIHGGNSDDMVVVVWKVTCGGFCWGVGIGSPKDVIICVGRRRGWGWGEGGGLCGWGCWSMVITKMPTMVGIATHNVVMERRSLAWELFGGCRVTIGFQDDYMLWYLGFLGVGCCWNDYFDPLIY